LATTLEPARDTDEATLLLAWKDLRHGSVTAARAQLTALAERGGSDMLPTILLWKSEAEARCADPTRASRTAAELRTRFPQSPEATLVGRAARLPADAGAVAASDRFTLQVASFEDRANALRLRDTLRGEVQGVRVDDVTVAGRHLYRVCVGRFDSR